jgi:hypothetical protein
MAGARFRLRRVAIASLVACIYLLLLMWLWSQPGARYYLAWLRTVEISFGTSSEEASGCVQPVGTVSPESVRTALRRNEALLSLQEAE